MLVGVPREVKEVRFEVETGILPVWARTSGQQSALSETGAPEFVGGR
jgi:hypothetical protein